MTVFYSTHLEKSITNKINIMSNVNYRILNLNLYSLRLVIRFTFSVKITVVYTSMLKGGFDRKCIDWFFFTLKSIP